jgi:hypothetical protein
MEVPESSNAVRLRAHGAEATPQEIANAMSESGTERGTQPYRNGASRKLAVAVSSSAWVAQLVERVLGKDEVTGSIPVSGSRF